MHFECLYPTKFLKAADLQGRDVTLTISKIEREEVVGKGGKSKVKVIFYFAETAAKAEKERKANPAKAKDIDEKRFICNITNARVIAAMYGSEIEAWVGQRITLYAAKVKNPEGPGKVDGLCVRDALPAEKKETENAESQPA